MNKGGKIITTLLKNTTSFNKIIKYLLYDNNNEVSGQ